MAERLSRIKKPIAVAVEGADYFHLLLSQVDGPAEFQDLQLFNFGGISDLSSWLRVFVASEGFRQRKVRSFGIIRDAEDDAEKAISAMKNSLRQVGLAVPERPFDVAGSEPSVGFLVLPHGRDSGCLEDACWDAATDGLQKECAEAFLDCVNNDDKNDNWRAKVKVHSLIASMDNPAMTLGQSGRANVWDFTHPSLQVILDFIRLLSTC